VTLQLIRAAYEQPIIAAFATATPPVPVFVENQRYTDDDSLSEFALVRLQWGEILEPVIGCTPMEFLRGVLIVELYTPKGTGPRRGQEVITPVMQALARMRQHIPGETQARISGVSGPTFTPLDGRPHLMTRLSARVRARYRQP
jgi:hypothetical protein